MSNVTRLKNHNMSMSEELYWYLREHQDILPETFTTRQLQEGLPHMTISHVSSAMSNLETRVKCVMWAGKLGMLNTYKLVPENFEPVPAFHSKNIEGMTRNYKPGIKHPIRGERKASKPPVTKRRTSEKKIIIADIDALRDTLLEACIKLEDIRKRIK